MHTIVGITTLSRDDHITTQTREYECTRYVLPQVLARGTISICCFFFQEQQFCDVGLNVVEVAHDFQQQIRRYVVEDLKLLNSYDTWHGKTHVYTYTSLVCIYMGTYTCNLPYRNQECSQNPSKGGQREGEPSEGSTV